MKDIAKATVIQEGRDFGWTYGYMAKIAGVAESTIRGWHYRGTGVRPALDLIERRLKLERTGKAPLGGKSERALVPGARAIIEEALNAGLNLDQIATLANTHKSTLHRWVRKDAGAQEGMDKIKKHLTGMWTGEEPVTKQNGSNGKFAGNELFQNMDLSGVQPVEKGKQHAPRPAPMSPSTLPPPPKEEPVAKTNEVCHYIVRVGTDTLITDPNLKVAVHAAIKKLEGSRDITAERVVDLVDRMEYDTLGYETSTLDSWRPVNSRVSVVTTWELVEAE